MTNSCVCEHLKPYVESLVKSRLSTCGSLFSPQEAAKLVALVAEYEQRPCTRQAGCRRPILPGHVKKLRAACKLICSANPGVLDNVEDHKKAQPPALRTHRTQEDIEAAEIVAGLAASLTSTAATTSLPLKSLLCLLSGESNPESNEDAPQRLKTLLTAMSYKALCTRVTKLTKPEQAILRRLLNSDDHGLLPGHRKKVQKALSIIA